MEYTLDRTNYRRAYARRTETQKEKKEKKLVFRVLKRLILQTLGCCIVFASVWIIKLLNITDILSYMEKELSKDIPVSVIFEVGQNKVKSLFNSKVIFVAQNTKKKQENSTFDKQEEKEIEEKNILSISTDVPTEPIYETAVEGVNQLKDDAEYIKSKYQFVYPAKATITSWFGVREPTNPIVPTYHSGIDIGAAQGTQIKAAIDGKVIKAENSGSYGKHIFIEKDDIVTIYAHCSTLKVKVGDMVKQGQVIGLVGSTGLSTGPHLHFEIRRDGRIVNPADILNFE